jgi:hypothetical protein
MKRYFIFFYFVFGFIFICRTQTIISNNSSLAITPNNSLVCTAGGFLAVENSYYQIYDLADYPNIVDTAFVVRMLTGCQVTSGGAYFVIGKVHLIQGASSISNLTYVSEDSANVYPDSSIYLFHIPFEAGYFLPNDSIAAELYMPANISLSYYPASNINPETSPTYVVSSGCSTFDMTDTETYAFACGQPEKHMHLIMRLYLNQKPTMNGFSKTMYKNDILNFAAVDFTSNFSDNDYDNLTMMKLTDLPVNGHLELSGSTLNIGDTILASELSMLTFSPDFNYSGADQFSVIVKDSWHWSNHSADIQINVLDGFAGNAESTLEEIIIFPVPAYEFITILVATEIQNVRLWDATGKLILINSIENNRLNIESLATGIYYLEITTEKGVQMQRFVKA